MNKSFVFIGIAIAIIIFWHLGMSSDSLKVSGPFQVTPKPDYVWQDNYQMEARYFWKDKHAIRWQAGLRYKPYHVISTDLFRYWKALPGYSLLSDNSLNTIWTPGLIDTPNHVMSSLNEGDWRALPGYNLPDYGGRNIFGDIIIPAHWDVGQKIADLKIIADRTEGRWLPYPGYRFVNPGFSYDVQWTPGVSDESKADSIAGFFEGTWVKKQEEEISTDNQLGSAEKTNGGDVASTVAAGITYIKIVELLFGKNSKEAEEAREEAAKQTIKTTVNYLKDRN